MERSPTLHELQALFWRALNGSVDPALEAAIVSTASLPGADRIGIYSRMYVGRLHDVLAEDFERTAATLGPERFGETVQAYLAVHPSEHPSVRHLGRHFAGFIASSPSAGTPPWLADLARLEWARVEVFDAADATPVTVERLADVAAEDWSELVLVPIPALQVLESAWPLHLIWRDGGDPRPDPSALRIWRQDGTVYHAAMDGLERKALARLRSGERFGEICEAMDHLHPETAAAEAGSLLVRWIEDGVIADLH